MICCTHSTLHVLWRFKHTGELKGFLSYFDCLNARGSIHIGHDQFSDESRGRQEVFMSFSALLCDQLWPVHQWRCEEIYCVLHKK